MAKPSAPIEITTKVRRGVAVYLFLGIGLIVSVIGALAYLFTTK